MTDFKPYDLPSTLIIVMSNALMIRFDILVLTLVHYSKVVLESANIH